ncbi:MAG: hypothetical protein N2320_05025 [Candidatus Bipolaricaulota bacterium]|nr:hypothetical protein [Candidatus Bipolaricaulota bacterium]
MKVAVVALAAVVGLLSAFKQVSHAQGVSLLAQTLPLGEELPDAELLEAEGEGVWIAAIIAGLIAGATAVGIYAVSSDSFSWSTAAYVFAIGFAGGALGTLGVYLFM